MRRPPIACQRAVQSLQSPAPQHIWVPDEVLSLAVNRFFRSTCPQQRRHGSNVPGPLEALRRAAKRRMTASAGFQPHDSFPSFFNIEALFGSRSKPWNSWKYEPPSLPKNMPPLEPPSPAWKGDQPRMLQNQASATDVSSIDHAASLSLEQQSATPTETYNKPLELISQSPPNLQATEHNSTDADVLGHCLDGFKAKLAATDDPCFNVQLQEAFMQCLPAAPFTWKYYAAVLQHVLQLKRSSRPVLLCLLQDEGRLLRAISTLHSMEDCADFMDELDRVSYIGMTGNVYEEMARLAIQGTQSTTEAHDLLLLRMFTAIGNRMKGAAYQSRTPPMRLRHALGSKLRRNADNELLLSHVAPTQTAQNVIILTVCRVADSVESFTSAERALRYMPHRQLLLLVPRVTTRLSTWIRRQQCSAAPTNARFLEIWVQLLYKVDNDAKAFLSAAMVSLAKGLSSRGTKQTTCSESLVKALLLHQGIDAHVHSNPNEPAEFDALLADVLHQLQSEPYQYTALLDLALPLIAEHAGIRNLLHCISTMQARRLPLSTTMNFDTIIEEKLTELRASTAGLSQGQLHKRASLLQTCEKLIMTLSKMGQALPAWAEDIAALSGIRQFQNILVRARAIRALPITWREATPDMPLMERVALVHQLAHHYSHDTTRTQREVWRYVYYLYKHLLSNALPIGPLFSKAVVHSSIVRPLSEHRFISARRLIWVCHIVARVEGDEVAARVENLYFAWRGDLLKRAKHVYVGVGGSPQNKAHVSTMKRLGLI